MVPKYRQCTPREINLLREIEQGGGDTILRSFPYDKLGKELFLEKTNLLEVYHLYNDLATDLAYEENGTVANRMRLELNDIDKDIKRKARVALDEFDIDRPYTSEETNLLREIEKGGAQYISVDMEWRETETKQFLEKSNLLEDWEQFAHWETLNEMGQRKYEIDNVLREMDKYDAIITKKASAILDELKEDREPELTPSDVELLIAVQQEKELAERIFQHFNENYGKVAKWGERTGIDNELVEAVCKRDDKAEALRNGGQNHPDLPELEKRLRIAENSLHWAINRTLNKIDLGQYQTVDYTSKTIKKENVMEGNVNDKLPDPEVLLVKEKESNEVKVVKGVDKDGKVTTTENEADFMKIDKNSNVLENFWANFKRQYNNPTEIFKVPLSMMAGLVKNLEALAKFKIDVPKKEHAIPADLVNVKKLEEVGVSQKYLEFKGEKDTLSNWDKLLNFQKTDLVPVSLKVEGMEQKLPTSARISLQKEANGTYSPKLHLIKQQPNLKEYFGVKFTEEDKENLLKHGNLGRIVEAEFAPGVKTPVLLSLDKQTNDIVSFRVENLKVPDTYKGVTLSEEQKRDLGLGKRVKVEDMISTNPKTKGQKFTGYVQFNADKRYFELSFDEKKQSQKQDNVQHEVPETFRKVKLTEEQRDKLSRGITIYIDGLVSENQKPYSGYITWNKETGKLDFMFADKYKEALAAGKVIPDDAPKKAEKQAENQDKKQDENEPKKTKGRKL